MNTRETTRQYRLSRWTQYIREQKASGLNIATWCEVNRISRNKYFYWQKKLRESVCEELALRPERGSPVAEFAEVKLPEANQPSAIIVRVNEAEIEISAEAPTELVETILKALRKPC